MESQIKSFKGRANVRKPALLQKELIHFIFISALNSMMMSHKLTQLALSRKLAIRQSQVSNWLAGKSLPSYESIQLLCNYFKVNANYFFMVS